MWIIRRDNNLLLRLVAYNSTIRVTAYGMSRSASTAVTMLPLEITITSDGYIPNFDKVVSVDASIVTGRLRCTSTHSGGTELLDHYTWEDFVDRNGYVSFKTLDARYLCYPSTGAVSGPSVGHTEVSLVRLTVYYN